MISQLFYINIEVEKEVWNKGENSPYLRNSAQNQPK